MYHIILPNKTVIFFQLLFENTQLLLSCRKQLSARLSGTSFEQAVSLDLIHEVHWKQLVHELLDEGDRPPKGPALLTHSQQSQPSQLLLKQALSHPDMNKEARLPGASRAGFKQQGCNAFLPQPSAHLPATRHLRK